MVSLGTNDPDGTHSAIRELVDEALELVGADRCLVWATIARAGARAGFNAVLHDVASANDNVRLVDWAALVDEEPDLLAFDAVHGTSDGYARRAAETVLAIRSCPDRGALDRCRGTAPQRRRAARGRARERWHGEVGRGDVERHE